MAFKYYLNNGVEIVLVNSESSFFRSPPNGFQVDSLYKKTLITNDRKSHRNSLFNRCESLA